MNCKKSKKPRNRCCKYTLVSCLSLLGTVVKSNSKEYNKRNTKNIVKVFFMEEVKKYVSKLNQFGIRSYKIGMEVQQKIVNKAVADTRVSTFLYVSTVTPLVQNLFDSKNTIP
jgi:hypothetical protein